MSIEGLLAAIVLTAVALIVVALPLLASKTKHSGSDPLAEKQRERLLVYYERVLRNMRDLDEDYALGKIASEEYEQERQIWASRGVEVLKALDTLTDQPMIAPTAAEDADVDRAIDDAIEAAVRDARRAKQPQADSVVE